MTKTEARTLLQVDLGNIYGDNLERQHVLRLFKDGKLKYQVGVQQEVLPDRGLSLLSFPIGRTSCLQHFQEMLCSFQA